MRALLAAGVPARAPGVRARAATSGWGAGARLRSRKIDRLPPGASGLGSHDSLTASERIWFEPGDAVDADLAEDLAGRTRAELADRLESALRGAVRRRLLGNAAIGSACSGGLDSTLVTALARDEIPDFVAFNASLVDESVDEGPWAERWRPAGSASNSMLSASPPRIGERGSSALSCITSARCRSPAALFRCD